jgi:pyrroline-5-carboxylate reductase
MTHDVSSYATDERNRLTIMDNARVIGIIGYGNMGSSLAQRFKKEHSVLIFDKDKLKTIAAPGLIVTGSLLDLVNKSDALVLAIKPQDFQDILSQIKDVSLSKLIISIAAGISTDYIEAALGQVKVVRAMPNIGAKIGESETCLCQGRYIDSQDMHFVNSLFMLIGRTWVLDEKMMDAATAICGSGPAYIFFDMENLGIGPQNLDIVGEVILRYVKALVIAAESVGFSEGLAQEFAPAIVGTSIALIKETGLAPLELRKQVTSKGGTTEAAIKVLSGNGSWSEAALAALGRAKELSKK